MPHDLGHEAIKCWLRKDSDNFRSRFPTEFVLNYDAFLFNRKRSSETKRTAMGAKFATEYSALEMGLSDEKCNTRTYKRKEPLKTTGIDL